MNDGELVKRLRAVVGAREEKCDGCPHKEDYPCCVDCLDKMHLEAADAIEELNRLRVAAEENRMHWQDMAVKFECDLHDAEGKIPKWVSVNERLPEKYKDVLVWFEYYRYGEYNRLFQTHGIGTYCGESCWMINHETGWQKLQVIAWQPLPTPPKEG